MENQIAVLNNNTMAVHNSLGSDVEMKYMSYLNFINVAPKTVSTYTKALRQMFQYFNDNGVTNPAREDLANFKEHLKATGHKPTTIQNYIASARIFFRWTAEEGIYPNIADHMKGAKLNREHKKDYLTSNQIKAVLDGVDRSSLQGKRDYAMLSLMVTGGLRTIEINRANIEDIRTVGDNTVLYVQGKGKEEKAEYIKISAPVERAIREYLKARGQADVSDPLFTSISNNSTGHKLSTRAVSGIVKNYLQKAGYDSEMLTAHSLRHTAVTLALLAGKDITEVQQFARHANIATTMIYNHALDQAKNSCGQAIADAIF